MCVKEGVREGWWEHTIYVFCKTGGFFARKSHLCCLFETCVWKEPMLKCCHCAHSITFVFKVKAVASKYLVSACEWRARFCLNEEPGFAWMRFYSWIYRQNIWSKPVTLQIAVWLDWWGILELSYIGLKNVVILCIDNKNLLFEISAL